MRFCFLKNRQNPGDSKVLIGVLSTYGAMEFSLRVLMQVFFGDSRSQDTCRGEAVVWFQFFFCACFAVSCLHMIQLFRV